MSDKIAFTNRLINESSPYLQQHAHNPVDWYPWSDEALARAKKEDKPILVSIGYSTCHWCHVMERESFEDEAVADFMNQHFINIKIDREERPDLDQIYMEACQLMTGSGGWPLNCFLLPDGRPFYAGTYYPPEPFHQRSSWSQILQGVANAYKDRRPDVEQQAERLTGHIARSENTFVSKLDELATEEKTFDQAFFDQLYDQLKSKFDTTYGGFGGAPKFPTSMPLQFLLAYGQREARSHVLFTLEQIIRGGIYDQLGGGFARYATDTAWLIPHFEKMLYDNALLVNLMAEAYKLTGKKLFKQAIEETLEFVEREMTHEDGGFYAALDADSEGVEGKFYVWGQLEIEQLLGESAALFNAYYGVSANGNWEGKNILWRPIDDENFQKTYEGPLADDWQEQLLDARKTLMAARSKRIRPGLDDKILLGWNALQCSAYAKAYEALQLEAYRDTAIRNMEFMLSGFATDDGLRLYRVYKGDRAKYDALLSDYAYLIAALLDVYRISGNLKWLKSAGDYVQLVIDVFGDSNGPLFYYSAAEQSDLILRQKEVYDSAQPSGNSTMAINLEKLGILLDRPDWRQRSANMLLAMKEAAGRYPSSFGQWTLGMLGQMRGILEIAIIGEESMVKAQELHQKYLPLSVLMVSEKPNDGFPLLKDKQLAKDTYIYVCRDYTCQYPVQTIDQVMQMIG